MPELISHALVIGLSIAVVTSLAGILAVMHSDAQELFAREMAKNICHHVKLAAEQLTQSARLSSIELELPRKLGNAPYTIIGSGHSIVVASQGTSHECIAGTQAQLEGSSQGAATTLMLSGNTLTISGA